jgi:hypothetical protein
MAVPYNSYEGECLVVIWVVSSFQFVYFMVVHFSYKLLTFQKIYGIMSFIGKLTRWAHFLQEYDFDIIYKASRVN